MNPSTPILAALIRALGRGEVSLTLHFRPAGAATPPADAAAQRRVTVESPIAGSVDAVLVQAGDRVEPGQPVAAVGGYEVESLVRGAVAQVLVGVGAAVKTGQPLLRLTPEAAADG